jgi:ferritin-like protein
MTQDLRAMELLQEYEGHYADPESSMGVVVAAREALRTHLTAQAARIEELEKDAARYRFIRAHSYVEVKCDSPRVPDWMPEKLDAAIDAAMGAEGKP